MRVEKPNLSTIKSQIELPQQRLVTRNGTTYTQDTSNIGKPADQVKVINPTNIRTDKYENQYNTIPYQRVCKNAYEELEIRTVVFDVSTPE